MSHLVTGGLKYGNLRLQVGDRAQGWQPCSVKYITLLEAKEEKKKTEGLIHDRRNKSDRIFHGRLRLKKGCFANDVDEDDDDNDDDDY
jgi:hypothetical protein